MSDQQEKPTGEIQNVKYVDIEEISYNQDVLLFLRKKLDAFAIECLRKVMHHHNNGGLNKTKIDNYNDHRKRYDAAFLILESQGFIEWQQDGISKPYFLTIRGRQLIHMLSAEKAQNKSLEMKNNI